MPDYRSASPQPTAAERVAHRCHTLSAVDREQCPGSRTVLIAALAVALAVCGGCLSSRTAPPIAPPSAPKPQAAPESPATFPLTMTDALGAQVTFRAAPQRIISLSPPLTEILYKLGIGDRVVGVTRFCKVPPAARAVPVGGVSDPSLEKIISLNPDAVFVTVGNPRAVVDALRTAGVSVFASDPKTYDQVAAGILTLARVCAVPAEGAKLAEQMRATAARVSAIAARVPATRQPRVLLVVWLDPLFVGGPGTYLDDMIRVCGARNAATPTPNGWKQYSVEMAVAANPQVIILLTEHTPGGGDVATQLQQLRTGKTWRTTEAVKRGRVVLIHSDLLSQTGTNLEQGLLQLAAGIHPDLFGAPTTRPADETRPASTGNRGAGTENHASH